MRTIRKQMFEQGHAPAWIPGDCAHCSKALSKHRSFTLDGVRLCQPCRRAVFFDSDGELQEPTEEPIELGVVEGWTRWLTAKDLRQWLPTVGHTITGLSSNLNNGKTALGYMQFERTEARPYKYRFNLPGDKWI